MHIFCVALQKTHDRSSARSSIEEAKQAAELGRMRQQLQDKDIKIDALQVLAPRLMSALSARTLCHHEAARLNPLARAQALRSHRCQMVRVANCL